MKKSIQQCLGGLLFLTTALQAQHIVPLYEGLPPNARKGQDLSNHQIKVPNAGQLYTGVGTPELRLYLPDKSVATGHAVVICPGGGYAILAMWEGDSIASRLAAHGIAAVVLTYRLPNTTYTENKEWAPLQDAQAAILYIRRHAAKYRIDPNKVGILGSSAGGHLASTIGTHYRKAYTSNPGNGNLRPDFMILNYPVISFADSLAHLGSRFCLAGPPLRPGEMEEIMKDYKTADQKFASYPISKEKIAEYSNEWHVDESTPPTFITHSNDDNVVKIANSILFIAALQRHRVPVQSFFYAKGGHGYGIRNPTSDTQWIDACIAWIKGGYR